MKPKSIGIIGGAGPLAGAALLERTLRLATDKYGCFKDADFPRILLISFPFSDMLSPAVDAKQIGEELNSCLNHLKNGGAEVLAIACNTLHIFLKDPYPQSLIHLPKSVAETVRFNEEPLVLCTSTSRKSELYSQFFPCSYPDPNIQSEVDALISSILKGSHKDLIAPRLLELLKNLQAKEVILGCTELSLFSEELSLSTKLIIDPLEILANKLIDNSFLN